MNEDSIFPAQMGLQNLLLESKMMANLQLHKICWSFQWEFGHICKQTTTANRKVLTIMVLPTIDTYAPILQRDRCCPKAHRIPFQSKFIDCHICSSERWESLIFIDISATWVGRRVTPRFGEQNVHCFFATVVGGKQRAKELVGRYSKHHSHRGGSKLLS